MRLFACSAILWFLLDQVSKYAIVHGMNLAEHGAIDVWPPFLTFRMGWNTGINFGLFSNAADAMRWFLVGLAVVIALWLIHWARTGLTHPGAHLAAGAIVGGAAGNALDRVIYGAVADVLNVSCCGIVNPFTFNIADIGICAGAFGVLIFGNHKKRAA
ncbi:MAG: signal peptidase II [Rhodobacteraceae bacterium]|nr:signal peptidase II [Paracoccaceae bacterium]